MWLYSLLMASVLTCCPGQDFTPEQIRLVDEAAASMMAARSVPGLAVAAVRGDQVLLTKGYGLRNRERNLPVTESTLFNVGSTSKAFTATLAAEAVGRGKMDWDAPLTTYLPNFRLQDDFRTSQASVRDALAHKLGIPSYWGVTTAGLNISRYDLVRRMQWFGIKYQFRRRFLYSNYGVVLAGAAVEEATGLPWDRAIHDIIFTPLGMTGSRVASTLREEDWDRVAISYSAVNGSFVPNDEKALLPSIESIAPAGAVYTSAEDVVKWMKFHLTKGKGPDGRQLVARDALLETYSSTMAVGSSSSDLTRDVFPVDDFRWDYGQAWYLGSYRGMRKVYHTGSYSQYTCRLVFLPDKNVAAWACASGPGDYDPVYLITRILLDLALGEEPWLNATTIATFPAPWKPPKPPAATTPAPTLPPGYVEPSYAVNTTELAGQYNHRAFGTFHVTQKLTYSMGTLLKGRLIPSPEGPDHFYQILDPPLAFRHAGYPEYPHGFPVTFLRNDSGELWGVRLPYLESILPPTFVRDGAVEPPSVPPTTTPQPSLQCAGVNVASSQIVQTAMVLLLAVAAALMML